MGIRPNTREVVISLRIRGKWTIRAKHGAFSVTRSKAPPRAEKCRCLRCCGITCLSMYKSQPIYSIQDCARLTTPRTRELGHKFSRGYLSRATLDRFALSTGVDESRRSPTVSLENARERPSLAERSRNDFPPGPSLVSLFPRSSSPFIGDFVSRRVASRRVRDLPQNLCQPAVSVAAIG